MFDREEKTRIGMLGTGSLAIEFLRIGARNIWEYEWEELLPTNKITDD